VRDDSKVVKAGPGTTRPLVRTFTSAGGELGAALWEWGRIVGLGWTAAEKLLIVEESARVRSPVRPRPVCRTA
jgi:hypothetical protein